MESIGAFDAKTRLSELLDRVAKGESFQITKHGRPVGRLVPAHTGRDAAEIAAAVSRLKGFRGTLRGLSPAEFTGLRHEGRRF